MQTIMNDTKENQVSIQKAKARAAAEALANDPSPTDSSSLEDALVSIEDTPVSAIEGAMESSEEMTDDLLEERKLPQDTFLPAPVGCIALKRMELSELHHEMSPPDVVMAVQQVSFTAFR